MVVDPAINLISIEITFSFNFTSPPVGDGGSEESEGSECSSGDTFIDDGRLMMMEEAVAMEASSFESSVEFDLGREEISDGRRSARETRQRSLRPPDISAWRK